MAPYPFVYPVGCFLLYEVWTRKTLRWQLHWDCHSFSVSRSLPIVSFGFWQKQLGVRGINPFVVYSPPWMRGMLVKWESSCYVATRVNKNDVGCINFCGFYTSGNAGGIIERKMYLCSCRRNSQSGFKWVWELLWEISTPEIIGKL